MTYKTTAQPHYLHSWQVSKSRNPIQFFRGAKHSQHSRLPNPKIDTERFRLYLPPSHSSRRFTGQNFNKKKIFQTWKLQTGSHRPTPWKNTSFLRPLVLQVRRRLVRPPSLPCYFEKGQTTTDEELSAAFSLLWWILLIHKFYLLAHAKAVASFCTTLLLIRRVAKVNNTNSSNFPWLTLATPRVSRYCAVSWCTQPTEQDGV